MQKAILALGCFWEPEEKFRKIKGIISTEVGYCGGNSSNVTYEEVCGGSTNHAEVVKLEYEENTISYADIIFEENILKKLVLILTITNLKRLIIKVEKLIQKNYLQGNVNF